MMSYMVGVSDVFFDTCLSKTGSLLFDNSSMDGHWVCRHIRRSLLLSSYKVESAS
jgi:hypothetical protein